MFKFGMRSDTIQFGILLFSGISMLGGFWSYSEAHFATASALADTNKAINVEREERRELKMEVDALYLHQIPASERAALQYPVLPEKKGD